MAQDLIPYDDGSAMPAPASAPFSPRRFLAAFRRKWWILLITTILPTVGAFLFTRNQPVDYLSNATMWVRGKMRLADVGQYTEDVQNFFGTQIQLLQSDRLQSRAVARVKSLNPDLKEPKDELGRLLVPRVRVTQAPKSSVFGLESRSSSGDYAKAYLDALLDEFLLYKKEIRTATSGDALASVSSQVYKQETELKALHEKLSQFQRDNNMALLEETLRGGGSQLALLNAQISMLQLDLRLLDATEVEKGAGVGANGETNAPASTAFGLPGLSSAPQAPQTQLLSTRQQLQMLIAQRDELAVNLKPKHPKIVKLNEEITRAARLAVFLEDQNQEQLKAAREAASIRIKSLQETATELAGKVGDANRRMAELERIRTDISRQQSFYERLLALLQGVDLNSSLNQEDFSVLERATEPRTAKSQAAIMTAGAGVAGLFLGLGILFLLARLDDRCDSMAELRARFPEPVFGQVPEMSGSDAKGLLPVLQVDDSRHLFVEACRNLRSSLLYASNPANRPKVILVTSAVPNEGKSTIAANLAMTLAMGGAKVLFLDADTRRGHVHQLLNTPAEPGLTDCLRNGGDLNRYLQSTSLPTLFLLPRGSRSNQAGEMFLGAAFDRLLQDARQQYDFVVVDTIPVFAADDTSTLAPKADGVLFVVRREFTSSRLAQEALELLYQRQTKVLGIVFNRVNSRSSSYGYYKYSEYYADNTPA